MKAVIIVVIAAVAIIGLGYYFVNSQYTASHLTAREQGPAATGAGSQGAAAQPGASNQAGANAQGQASGRVDGAIGDASMHPENDSSQFQNGHGNDVAVDASKNNSMHSNISFEGAELPSASDLANRKRLGMGAANHAGEWKDPMIPNPADASEPTEIYVPRKSQTPHKAIAGHPGHINDDLLIMEGRSEDRLASGEASTGSAH